MNTTADNLHLKLNKVVLMIVSIVTTLFATSIDLNAAEPVSNGGSNYAWYSINQSVRNANSDTNCREDFGIIANYHNQNVRSTVTRQLSSMFENGQRRLRVPIFHSTDVSTGTVLRSTGGNLSQQARNNLANFMADIESAGFEEIIVGFFPISQSNPKNWLFYNEAAMQENWNLIRNIRPVVVAADIDYKIDLQNEGAAASNQPINRRYVSDIWSLYNAAYGKADTIGFSVATGTLAERTNPDQSRVGDIAVDRYNVMKQVYAESGFGDPNVWDFHAYQFLGTKISKVDAAMAARGDTTDIMIGETFYQDPGTLIAIQNLSLSRSIRAVYAWPVTTARGCDGHVDTVFPDEYLYAPTRRIVNDINTNEEIIQPELTPVAEQSVEQPIITVAPVVQSLPVCTSSAVDPDGDGWGWENNRSCIVERSVQTSNADLPRESGTGIPICASANSDSDGDGWGWENNASCLVQ